MRKLLILLLSSSGLLFGQATTVPSTKNAVPYYSDPGKMQGIPAPTTPDGIPQMVTSTPSAGIAGAPVWSPLLNAGPLTITPTTLAFGTINLGQSAQQIITLCAGTTTGAGGKICNIPSLLNIGLSSIGISVDGTDFSSNSNCPTALVSGATCAVTVTFSPQSSGTKTGSLTIPSNTTTGTYTVALSGTAGTAPSITLSSIAISPSSGSLPVGGTEAFSGIETFSDSSTQNIAGPSLSWSVSGGGTTTVTLINGPTCATGSAQTLACTSATTQAGDFIGVWMMQSNTGSGLTLTVPTDTLGNNYTCNTQIAHFRWCYTFAKSTGTNAPTIAQSTCCTTIGGQWLEFSGVPNTNFLDPGTPGGTQIVAGSSTTAITTGNFTTSGSSDLILGCMGDTNESGAFTVGAGFTLILNVSGVYSMCEYATAVAAGTQAVTGTGHAATATWNVIGFPLQSGTTTNAKVNANGIVTGLATGSSTLAVNSYNNAQQSNSNNCLTTASVSTLSCVYSNANAQGNTSVVLVGWDDATAVISTIADTAGNTYTLGSHIQGNTLSVYAYYSQNIPAAGNNTVTVTWTGNAVMPDIRLIEVNGAVGGLDSGATGAASTATALCSAGSLSTSNAYDALIGMAVVPAASAITGSTPSSSPGGVVVATVDSDGNALLALPTFATSNTGYTATASAGPCAMAVLALKTKGTTAALTITSTQQTAYRLQNPPPVSLVFYPNTFSTTPLPADVGNHCLGNVVCGSASDVSNGLAIVSNSFGGNIANAASMVLTTSPTVQAGVDGHTLYYTSQSDPIYCVTAVSHVPATSANNPVGQCFHITVQAQFSAESSDQFLNVWDQSSDISSVTGGRILSLYQSNPGTPAVVALPSCNCTTVSCAQTTTSCQISTAGYGEMNFPFNDPFGYNDAAGAYASSHFAGLTGIVRQLEWSSGTINHALILNANCMSDSIATVFPSFGVTHQCGDNNPLHYSNGSLLWIDAGYTCSSLPGWQQPYCVAMQTYGGYIVDSGGTGPSGGILDTRIENGVSWTVAGLTEPAPIFTYLAGAGSTNGLACSGSPTNKCTFPMFNMPGLLGHLHVVDSCVVKRMTGQPGAC